jgi:glycosyltransferase involved in cell wall biosynthesis
MDLTSTRGLARIIEASGIDIVHAHVARDYPVVALAAAPKHRARLVLTRHHYLPIKGNILYRRLLAKATIIAVSESVRRTVIESLGAPARQVVTIPNWIDLERASEPRKRSAERHAYGVTRRVAIALIGQITPLKGHEEFLSAVARVSAERTDVEFLIVGEDNEPGVPFETRLRRRARELGVEPYVRFLGYQSDLFGVLAAVDAVAVPSWNEAFSLVAAEAMAAGRPVIASKVGGLAEIVEHETTGLLVPPRDDAALAEAILRLAEDPALVEHLGHQAQGSARRFARGPGIDKVVEVYRRAK